MGQEAFFAAFQSGGGEQKLCFKSAAPIAWRPGGPGIEDSQRANSKKLVKKKKSYDKIKKLSGLSRVCLVTFLKLFLWWCVEHVLSLFASFCGKNLKKSFFFCFFFLKKSKNNVKKKKVGAKTDENQSKQLNTDFFLHCTR